MPLEFISLIISYGENVFPNLRMAFQIHISTTFQIKSNLKILATMGQYHISDAFLSVESEKFAIINIDN